MTTEKKIQPYLIFLHIPKTAGYCLYKLLMTKYKKHEYIIINFSEHYWKIKELQQNIDKIKLIMGHFSYGVHKYLPSKARYIYITVLREPINRLISFYWHIYNVKENEYHYFARNMSFKEFIKNINDLETCHKVHCYFNNGQARQICCTNNIEDNNFIKNPELLSDIFIKRLLNNFSLAGLTENFDATLLIIANIFNWKEIPCYNIIKGKKPANWTISDEEIELIKEYNKYDIQLYEFAQKNFYELLKKQSQSFKEELKKYSNFNKKHFNSKTQWVNKDFVYLR